MQGCRCPIDHAQPRPWASFASRSALAMRRHIAVGSLQGAAQRGGVLDVCVDHLVAEPAHRHPGVGGVHPAESLDAIQVVDGGTGCLAEGGQKGGQELVADGVLYATEAADGLDRRSDQGRRASGYWERARRARRGEKRGRDARAPRGGRNDDQGPADEGFDALGQVAVGLKLPGARRAERLVEEPLIGGEDLAAMRADHAGEEGEARVGVGGGRRSGWPSLSATSWIGKRGRFGATSTTSTLLPSMRRLTCSETWAET